MALITDPDLLEDSAADDGSQEVYINTSTKRIKLVTVGNLSNDGVAEKALYSFLKEEWRNDPNSKNLAAFPFPMVPITDEFFELTDGWDFFDDTGRNLIRNGGWLVRNTSGNVTQHYAGIKTTGSTESNDQLYYELDGSSGKSSPTNFVLPGPANQAVKVIDDPNGDGNYVDGFSRTTNIKVFNREQAQLFSLSSTSANGEATLTAPKVFGLDASTGTDLKVTNSDATVGGANDPYDKIKIRYFDQVYARDVDTVGTQRSFGIVIDVGTHSGVDGASTASGNVLTSVEGGIPTDGTYNGGTLTIHEGANKGVYTIGTISSVTQVPITGTFPSTVSNQSFTLQRAVPVTATAEQIYEKEQWFMRQNSDIDSTDQSVIGKVADQLLEFVGDTLKTGTKAPVNPNGGGSGVFIEGFASADTNRITFRDNGGTDRTFPFVAVLTLNFGANLVADPSAKYWVYFTTLPGAGNDWGEAGALIVDDNSAADMSGNVSGQASIQRTFNYDGNVQGGRTPGTDAPVTVIAEGLAVGQYVRATGTIERSTTNVVSLVAALERQYANP